MLWTFWVILFIVAVFMAVLIAKAIYTPIKRKREDKKWQQWKKDHANWGVV